MSDLLIQLLILCPLVFLAGFVDAVAGGGGLISIPAYLIAGVPIHNAIATNKLSGSLGLMLTTYRFSKQGFIRWRTIIIPIICSFIGSVCGAKLALFLDAQVFKIIMLIILPLTALYVFKGKALSTEPTPLSPTLTAVLSSIIAFVLGGYDGFYGPGTGTFLILLLVALAHVSIKQANGTAKAINLATNMAALITFIINGQVLFIVGGIAALFALAGNWAGSQYFIKGGSKSIKYVILPVLLIFMIKIIYELTVGA